VANFTTFLDGKGQGTYVKMALISAALYVYVVTINYQSFEHVT